MNLNPLHSNPFDTAVSQELFGRFIERCPSPEESKKIWDAAEILRWIEETLGKYDSQRKQWIFDTWSQRGSDVDENGSPVMEVTSMQASPKQNPTA